MAAAMQRDAKQRVAERSGSGAVSLSMQQNSMQTNTYVVAADDKDEASQILIRNSLSNQFVGNKSFTNQSAAAPVWVDSEYSAEKRLPETNVQFASDEYFGLVATEPGLAQYFALGEQVVVVWKGKVYRITK